MSKFQVRSPDSAAVEVQARGSAAVNPNSWADEPAEVLFVPVQLLTVAELRMPTGPLFHIFS